MDSDRLFTILIYLDAPVDVLKALENLAPKTLLLSRKIEYKNLPVLPVNFDKFQIAPTIYYGRCDHENLRICSFDI